MFNKSSFLFKKITFLLIVFCFGSANIAHSEGINAWKQCGIGAMIFNDNQTAAAISNIIWDLGTTALSSKISSQENCKGAEAKTAMFINESYDKLSEETAAGKGVHLTAMMDIMQCSDTSRETFISAIRADFANELSNDETAKLDRIEKAEQYFYIVNRQYKNSFKSSCSAI